MTTNNALRRTLWEKARETWPEWFKGLPVRICPLRDVAWELMTAPPEGVEFWDFESLERGQFRACFWGKTKSEVENPDPACAVILAALAVAGVEVKCD